mmetsp:Transcript_13200/g.39150  ORF Transcript_13200/g.39150 Transcript_13200/m.39150 type:complete len:298 (-) Transcript_13200:25-918(-)
MPLLGLGDPTRRGERLELCLGRCDAGDAEPPRHRRSDRVHRRAEGALLDGRLGERALWRVGCSERVAARVRSVGGACGGAAGGGGVAGGPCVRRGGGVLWGDLGAGEAEPRGVGRCEVCFGDEAAHSLAGNAALGPHDDRHPAVWGGRVDVHDHVDELAALHRHSAVLVLPRRGDVLRGHVGGEGLLALPLLLVALIKGALERRRRRGEELPRLARRILDAETSNLLLGVVYQLAGRGAAQLACGDLVQHANELVEHVRVRVEALDAKLRGARPRVRGGLARAVAARGARRAVLARH